ALGVIGFGAADVARRGRSYGFACRDIRVAVGQRYPLSDGKVDAVVAGTAGHATGKLLPVVAIRGLVGVDRSVGLRRRTIVTLGAVALVLRETDQVEALAAIRIGAGVTPGGSIGLLGMGIQVVAGLDQVAAHMRLVNHARVGERRFAIDPLVAVFVGVVVARRGFFRFGETVFRLVGVAGHAKPWIITTDSRPSGNPISGSGVTHVPDTLL